MTREKWINAATLVLLAAVGALAWKLQLRPELAVDASSLDALPYAIGAWQGRDVPIEDEVSKLLDATRNVQRAYAGPDGGVVWLYVGYYGTERGGKPEHTPWVCYPTAGWEIVRSERLAMPGQGDQRVNELVVVRGGTRRLVHFYYRSHRKSGLTGGLDQMLDQLTSRLLTGRADGALVRLSTPIEGDERLARGRLEELGREIDALFPHHWPREHTGAAGALADTPAA